MPSARPETRRIRVQRDGPLLVEGPVELVCDDGTTLHCERFQVAVCTCRRSRTYPLCDTSHRHHPRHDLPAGTGRDSGTDRAGHPDHHPGTARAGHLGDDSGADRVAGAEGADRDPGAGIGGEPGGDIDPG